MCHFLNLLISIFIINYFYCSTMSLNFGWLSTFWNVRWWQFSLRLQNPLKFKQKHPIQMILKWLEQWNTFKCLNYLVSCIWTLNTFRIPDTGNVLLPGPSAIIIGNMSTISAWFPLNKISVKYIWAFL